MNFCVSTFPWPIRASVNCVNSYKIYTMFNNNFPFKLNFSKWNRISLTLSSFAFFYSHHKNQCVVGCWSFCFYLCAIPNCLACFFSAFHTSTNIFMNYSKLRIHRMVSAFFFRENYPFASKITLDEQKI